jgi:hypothetical protein
MKHALRLGVSLTLLSAGCGEDDAEGNTDETITKWGLGVTAR